MNKTQLEYFVEVYERKSFTKAAEYLIISQQGVSKTIKSLEAELKKKLFIRQKNSLICTAEADELYIHAKNILEEYFLISNTFETRYRKVVIYAIDSVIDYYLSDFITEFQMKHPNIALKIMESSNDEASRHLLNDDCDIALLQTACISSGVINEFLFESPIVIVAHKNNPLANTNNLSEESFDNIKLAGRGFEYVLFDRVFKNLRKKHIYPITITETNNPMLLIELAKKNIAVVAVNEAVARYYACDDLVIMPVVDESANDKIHLSHKSNISAETKLFINELKLWISTT